ALGGGLRRSLPARSGGRSRRDRARRNRLDRPGHHRDDPAGRSARVVRQYFLAMTALSAAGSTAKEKDAIVLETSSAAATHAFGQAVGASCTGGEVIALIGPLGA